METTAKLNFSTKNQENLLCNKNKGLKAPEKQLPKQFFYLVSVYNYKYSRIDFIKRFTGKAQAELAFNTIKKNARIDTEKEHDFTEKVFNYCLKITTYNKRTLNPIETLKELYCVDLSDYGAMFLEEYQDELNRDINFSLELDEE